MVRRRAAASPGAYCLRALVAGQGARATRSRERRRPPSLAPPPALLGRGGGLAVRRPPSIGASRKPKQPDPRAPLQPPKESGGFRSPPEALFDDFVVGLDDLFLFLLLTLLGDFGLGRRGAFPLVGPLSLGGLRLVHLLAGRAEGLHQLIAG